MWDPTGKGKTSIRASYGLLYDTPHMFFYTRVSNNPPWGATLSLPGGPYPLSNPWSTYPGGDPFKQSNTSGKSFGFFPTAGVYAVSDLDLKNPQVSTWNLSIQRQLGKWLVTGTYLGNHTAHLWSSRKARTWINTFQVTALRGQYRSHQGWCMFQHFGSEASQLAEHSRSRIRWPGLPPADCLSGCRRHLQL